MKLTNVLLIIIAVCLVIAIFQGSPPKISSQKNTNAATIPIITPILNFLSRNIETILVGIVILIIALSLRVFWNARQKEKEEGTLNKTIFDASTARFKESLGNTKDLRKIYSIVQEIQGKAEKDTRRKEQSLYTVTKALYQLIDRVEFNNIVARATIRRFLPKRYKKVEEMIGEAILKKKERIEKEQKEKGDDKK